VLRAYQPVGPNIERLARVEEGVSGNLVRRDRRCRTGHLGARPAFPGEPVARLHRRRLRDAPDRNCGGEAAGLYRLAASTPGVIAEGLHVYDGHIHDADLASRERAMREAFEPVHDLVEELRPKTVIGGGSPTFALHAGLESWECSPGTTLLWDAGYAGRHPDLGFEPAVCLLTRVISKPGAGRLCLDLGHKAVAAESPLPRRAQFLELKDAEPVMHSEEHLVVEYSGAESIHRGTRIYALPRTRLSDRCVAHGSHRRPGRQSHR